MKKGERNAVVFIGLMMAAIVGSTVYMEMNRSASDKEAGAGGADRRATQLIPAGLHPADLPEPDGRGARLMGIYCVQCHELPSPAMHTREEWVAVLSRMDQHMTNQGGGMIVRILRPSDQDAIQLESYVQAHALVPLREMQRVDAAGTQGAAFKAACSDCHALPDPGQHTGSEWRRVVARMKINMSHAGRTVPNESQTTAVLDFLAQGAKSD